MAAALALSALLMPPAPPPKKLLQWGWDEPDTAYLRAHLTEMEQSPFDGCVFGVRYGPGGSGGSFSWQAWSRRRFTESDLSSAFADLRGLRPGRFKDLFLRLNVTPGDVGWFQDHSAILANARLAASLARAGRARGILLDVEQYQGQVFDFRRQPLAAAYGWSGYATQARRRGREVMAAFQQGYPGLTVFLTFGPSLAWVQMIAPASQVTVPAGPPPVSATAGGAFAQRSVAPRARSDSSAARIAGASRAENATQSARSLVHPPAAARRPLADVPYGLLAPFVDGLLDGARGQTHVVDGFELSYGFKERAQFASARQLVYHDVLPIIGARSAYGHRIRLAFGLWLDFEWRRRGWNSAEIAKNYFSPEHFVAAVREAQCHSDGYVWVYAETVGWWRSKAQMVPPEYRVLR